MKEIILLTKVLLKSSTNDKKLGEKKINKTIFFILIYGYIIGVISYLSYSTIKSLILINQPAVFLNLIFIMLFTLGFIQSTISSINILYFSKDLEYLIQMPINPIKIIISKFNCLVISQYIISAFLALPGIIIYGYLLNLQISFYIMGILILLLFPLIPVAIVSLIVSIIIKFTKLIKNKETIQYFTVILTTILLIAIMSFSGTSGNLTEKELADSLIKFNGLSEVIIEILPNIKLIMNSILNYNNITGIISLILFGILSTSIYYISSMIISKPYVNIVMSLDSIKLKKIKNIDTVKDLKKTTIYFSYLKKELKLLFRNPIFFMQCVLPSILFPIIIGLPLFFGKDDLGIDVNALKGDFSIVINSSFGLMLALVVVLFMYIFNYASITAVSRDGVNAVFMKYIPLAFKRQIIYKASPGILLNIFPMMYVIIFLLIFVPDISLRTVIYIFLISLFINVLTNIYAVLIDFNNPKLKWISEYVVVKQNFNMFFIIIIATVEIGVVLLLASIILDIDKLALTLLSVCLVLYLITKRYINKNQLKIFKKIM